MIKNQVKILSDLTTESKSIEELMNKTKTNLDEQALDCEDCSELSLTSKPYTFIKTEQDDRHIFYSTVHRGTASGGIMQDYSKMPNRNADLQSIFPNFQSDNLYGEIPVEKNIDIEDPIIYEGKSEMIGCCRLKFFCF